MILHQYLGVSAANAGATRFTKKSLLRIEEGFKDGLEEYYQGKGLYELETQNINNFEDGTIRLSLNNELDRRDTNQIAATRVLKTSHFNLIDFTNNNDASNNFDLRTPAGITERPDQGYVRATGTACRLTYKWGGNFQNLLVTSRFRFSSDALGQNFQNLLRLDVDDPVKFSLFAVDFKPDTNIVTVSFYHAGTLIGSSDTAFTLNANIWYYSKVMLFGRHYRVLVSANGKVDGWTTINDGVFPEGVRMPTGRRAAVNLSCGAGSLDLSEFEIMEYGDVYTQKDVIEEAVRASNVHNIDYNDEYVDLSSYTKIAPAGSTWRVISPTEVQYDRNSTGGSIALLLSGVMPEDFVAEFETRGASLLMGAFAGRSGAYMVPAITLTTGSGGAIVENQLAGGATIYRISGNGSAVNTLEHDTWHKIKFFKKGAFVGLIANGMLAIGGYGTSWTTLPLRYPQFGLAVPFYFGANGATISFKNVKISRFSRILEGDIVLDSGQPLRNLLDSILEDGDEVLNQGETLLFLKAGDSRGNLSVTAPLLALDDTINTNAGVRQAIAYGNDNAIVIEENENLILSKNKGDYRASSSQRLDTTSVNKLRGVAESIIKESNTNVKVMNASIPGHPLLEVLDSVTVTSRIGTTGAHKIRSVNNEYNFETGEFKSNLVLGKYSEQ